MTASPTGAVDAAGKVGHRTAVISHARGPGLLDLCALMAAAAVSAVGEAMAFVAIPWFVLETTGSIATTGIIVAVAAIGSAVAGGIAGPFVDRLGMRRACIASYATCGVMVAGIPVLFALDLLRFWSLAALVLVANALGTPGALALRGMVPELAQGCRVPIERANSALRVIGIVAQLAGPVAAGAGAAMLGAGSVLLCDALGCLLSALFVLTFVRSRRRDGAAQNAGPLDLDGFQPWWRAYLAAQRNGLNAIRQSPLLRGLTGSSALYGLLDSGLSGAVVISCAHLRLGGASGLAPMMFAISLGMLTGTVVYGLVGHRIRRRPVYIGSRVATAALLPALIADLPGPAILIILASISATMASVGPLRASVLHVVVPSALYGRVVGAMGTVIGLTVPVGVAATAMAIECVGLGWAIAGLAGAYLVVSAACARMAGLRDMDRVQLAGGSA